MKDAIHPKYQTIEVKCSCGNNFATRSTLAKKTLHIEICSECHPFYTGKHKIIDSAGRVDKFNKKFAQRGTILKKASDTDSVDTHSGTPTAT